MTEETHPDPDEVTTTEGDDDGSEGEVLVDPGAPEGAPEVEGDDDEEQVG